jgi:hypothetical protein
MGRDEAGGGHNRVLSASVAGALAEARESLPGVDLLVVSRDGET